MPSLQARPYMLGSREGEVAQIPMLRLCVKAGTIQTGGTFDLFDISAPAGFSTPLHILYAEDVAVYVLHGSLTFFWGDEGREALAGSYLFMPRGTPHGFRVTSQGGARFLYFALPGGLDRLVHEWTLCSDASACMAAAAAYKIEFLGPLPD